MRSAARPYLLLARAGFQRQSRYRLAMAAGLITNVVFGFIRSAILFAAVRSAGGELAGYSAASISAYVWLSQGLLGAIELSGNAEIGTRVRTGDVAVDFARPVDIQFAHLAADLGRAGCTFIPRGVPSVLVGALTVGLALPGAWWPYALGVTSIVLGVVISFLCRYAVNLAGFWLIETRGVRTFYSVAATFLAGLYVPVHLFPDWLRTLAYCTPFPSILQTPIDVFSGRLDLGGAAAAVGAQCGWVVVVCLLGRAVTAAGRQKLVVQGG